MEVVLKKLVKQIGYNKINILLYTVIALLFIAMAVLLYSKVSTNNEYKRQLRAYTEQIKQYEQLNKTHESTIFKLNRELIAHKDSIDRYNKNIVIIQNDYEKLISKYNAYSNDSVISKFYEYISKYKSR